MSAHALAVIPARIGSSRLHRKPLHLLADRPLIEWVWRRVVETAIFDRVVIATDSAEVAEAAERFGADALLTSADHPSGTDRVAEVARMPEFEAFSTITNIQGDEPFVRADQLRSALQLVRGSGWPIGTVAALISSVEEWRDPAVVKVARGSDGRAIFFSRAPIPHRRDGTPGQHDWESGLFLRHIGIYAYQRDALLRWVGLPEGDLERLERLEQLRPLAAGIDIGVATVSATHADAGVDTPADAERADLRLRHETSRENIVSL